MKECARRRSKFGCRNSCVPKKSADIHSGPAESRMDVRLNCSGRLDGGETSGLAPCVPLRYRASEAECLCR
ncbi:hypothetical protein [Burkholderia sp. ABCPW 14]|uniref:hypothetical protein n=1 Tax=Burkholderia sp. ABCPW 14 TaxID=1637860 RepID=UPI0012E3E82B